jgi:primosomal replication protein N
LKPPDNQLLITACIAQAQPLRYTPAGLPAVDLMLEHSSSMVLDRQARQVEAKVKAVAFGAAAETLVRQPIGSVWRFSGFVSSPRGKSLVFHIQAFSQD